jgi:hypothetical protein
MGSASSCRATYRCGPALRDRFNTSSESILFQMFTNMGPTTFRAEKAELSLQLENTFPQTLWTCLPLFQ